MNYTCLIVDDERPAIKLLQAYVDKLPFLEVKDSCESAIQALSKLQESSYDILFLDIQMPELTGLGLLKVLKNKPEVILTTAYRDYAVEGFALEVTDYLVKPFSFDRFLQGVNKAINNLNAQTPPIPQAAMAEPAEADEDHFFIRNKHKMDKVEFAEILHVESMREYVAIHTSKKRYVVHQTMNKMEALLPPQQFMRVHRSHIVNLKKITQVFGNTIAIGESQFPIGGNYRKTFFDQLNLL